MLSRLEAPCMFSFLQPKDTDESIATPESVIVPPKTYEPKMQLIRRGSLFMKCMQQVTRGHLYHMLRLSDYYAMYRQRAKADETSAKVTWGTDPFRSLL